MKTITNFENTILWHNMKKAFFSLQMLVMTAAIPVLLYIGLNHQDSSLKDGTKSDKVINVTTAKTNPATTGASIIML